MSQKLQIYQHQSTGLKPYGKYFVRPVYDHKFITTDELAEFIQSQCSVRVSDCKAVLEELGSALKHYLEMGQKIKINKIGVFKVGVTSIGSPNLEGCTASNVKSSQVIFLPETVSSPSGKTHQARHARVSGDEVEIVTYNIRTLKRVPVMIKDIRFELAKDSVGNVSPEGNDLPGE